MPSHADRVAEVSRRLQAARDTLARLEARDAMLSRARGAIFLGGAVLVFAVVSREWLPAWTLLVPAVAFLWAVIAHDRAITGSRVAARSVGFWSLALDRLEDRWSGRGESGDRFLDPAHPYAGDLDVFGTGSLFQRISTARTRTGEDTLAAWLLAPASAEEVRGRQSAIAELSPRLDLREELALLGDPVRAGVDVTVLAKWGAAPRSLDSRATWAALGAITLGAVVALIAWPLGAGPAPVMAFAIAGQAFSWSIKERVEKVLSAVERAGRELSLLALLLERMEREAFTSPWLRDLQQRIDAGGGRPSHRIARLGRMVELLDARQNQIFAPLAFLILWGAHWAFAIEAWRAKNGPAIAGWIRAVGEFEAICSLAAYAWESPEDPFPALEDATPGGAPRFAGEGLAHPLLPVSKAVRNDVTLGEAPRLLLVSGSNMSGKSTLLRTVGANVVLALAGAPVRARRVSLSALQVGASLRTQDSLQGGVSRFYAEITRLRDVVARAGGEPPLLFLLDEILHGTNSHDRAIGAEGIVRALAKGRAIGMVTTHDLALTRIVDGMGAAAANVHFEDQLENGKMTFDYHLRPGVVTKSNAIALMRSVGLEV